MLKTKMIYRFLSFCCLCLLVATSYAAPTNKNEAVQINLQLFKVVLKDGKEALVDAKETKPGETVEYRATYKNVSKSAVRNLKATLPVPDGMEYVAKTVNPANAEASTDKKSFAVMPLMRSNGKDVIPTKEYRAVRWLVPELAADKSFVVSARMKVAQQ